MGYSKYGSDKKYNDCSKKRRNRGNNEFKFKFTFNCNCGQAKKPGHSNGDSCCKQKSCW